jgi:CheY-like chemotaxis protein
MNFQETQEKMIRRILVVDDNHDAADTLAMMLKLTGNQVHTCYDGLSAVAAAETFNPMVILLDIGMPDLNGYETCRLIRQKPWGESIIIIALTGYGLEEDIRKSKEAGFDAHLLKPVDLNELMNTLDQMISKRA